MKNIIISCILICSSIFVDAQNNLEFNQVLNFRLSPNQSVTVPDGKAWKVENSDGTSLRLTSNSDPYPGTQPLNGQEIEGTGNGLAIWLSEGVSFTVDSSIDRVFSILEFNVVPISSTGSGTVDTGISNGSLPGDDYTPGDSFSDTDGNIYETVEVNGQTWTTTNLNVSTYRDGTPIPYISDFSEWNSANTGAYTYAAQDSNAGYGKLYNVYALGGIHDNDGATPNKILAPEGYHIPSPQEWKDLINIYLSGASFNFNYSGITNGTNNSWQADIASTFLKSQTSWNNNGNNESGLNIKKYPIITNNGYDDQVNFNNVNDNDFTHFATNQVYGYFGGGDIYFFGVSVGEFTLESIGLYGYGLGNNLSQSGFYIRLIKDN